jgi:trimeric autotransporter adhesin
VFVVSPRTPNGNRGPYTVIVAVWRMERAAGSSAVQIVAKPVTLFFCEWIFAPMSLLFGLRKWLRSYTAKWFRPANVQPIRSRRWCRPWLEELENRTLLSVTASVSGHTATFTGTSLADNDNLYLMSQGGALEYNTDGSSNYTAVGLQLNADTTLNINIGGTLHLEGLATTKTAALTIDTTGASGILASIDIAGNILTSGGNLTISGYQNITVDPGVIVSTRQLASGGNPLTDVSTGNSGNITFSVENSDQYNPILNIRFQTPTITIGSNAQILANTTITQGGSLVPSPNGYQGGEITITATNTSYNVSVAPATDLSLLDREADLYVDSSAVIRGNDVTLTATGGDVSIINPNETGSGGTAGQIGALGESVGISEGLSILGNKFPLLGTVLQPQLASFVYKAGTGRVEVGNNAVIDADGSVNVSATANAFATSQAQNQSAGANALAISVAYAQSNTYALIDPDATINAGGQVSISTSGITIPIATAAISQDLSEDNLPNNVKQLAIAVGITDMTSTAQVSQGASIVAGGDISVSATGTNTNGGVNGNSVETQSYRDGSAGVGINVNISTTNILSEVDGSLNANTTGQLSTGSQDNTQTFNPFNQVDLADSIINFGQADGYTTGDRITYATVGSGAPIDGL